MRRIRELESRSSEKARPKFIETPYRNDALLGTLLEACKPQTKLRIAADLTLPGESIRTSHIAAWRRANAVIGRRPAVFLLLAD